MSSVEANKYTDVLPKNLKSLCMKNQTPQTPDKIGKINELYPKPSLINK